jgi:hypothetical protein
MIMQKPKRYKWRAFISHNKKQRPWVKQVVDQWRGLGLSIFFDEDSIDFGEEVTAGIERGLKGSRHIVLVISPDAVASHWVALETAVGIYGDPEAQARRIIPVEVVPTAKDTIRPAIAILNSIDLTDPNRRRENYHRPLVALKVKKGIPLPDPPDPNSGPTAVAMPRPSAAPDVRSGNGPAEGGKDVGRIELVIEGDFNSFTLDRQKIVLEDIEKVLRLSSNVRVIGKRPGSVRLELQLPPEEAEKLLWAVQTGALSELGVVRAEILRFNQDRKPKSVELKLRRMRQSAFTFFLNSLARFWDV